MFRAHGTAVHINRDTPGAPDDRGLPLSRS
jgi:hypothetical protein